MLFYHTVSPELLGLLKEIQEKSIFHDLRLVGGTSLALQIGHRKSIDLDLFGQLTADDLEVMISLESIGTTTVLNQSRNIKIFLVNGIKIDIVNYPYRWLESAIKTDNITLAGIKDIAAMKLNAIIGRGTKKDFIDLYFLLKTFSLNEMIGFFVEKYPNVSHFMLLKSLVYFEDADENEMPIMFDKISWDDIKSFIITALNNYLRQG